jgi:hypothetical protein
LLAAPTIASAGVLVFYVYCKLLDLPPWPESGASSEGEGKDIVALHLLDSE